MRRLWILTVVALAIAPATFAADSYRNGRIRDVEDGVTIQRGTDTGAEEAVANMPYLPGDRVWTDEGGRVEFQFGGGSVVRLDRASKLDYLTRDEGREDRVVLRLWSGAAYLHLDRRDGPFDLQTPSGVVTAGGRSVLRVDVQSGETRVSVYEGEASLDAGQAVRLAAGERAYARGGEIEEEPSGFDRADGDEFTDWDGARQEQTAYASTAPQGLPDEVTPYADELDHHGAWYYEQEVGHVWRPYVASGWQPYSNGRWTWTVYGWTWVPYEPWGWATSHFGRWGFSPALGWYWIPGATWSPAWVSWAVGGSYVGWCPLGYHDQPVLVSGLGHYHSAGGGGYAVSRGVQLVASPWMYLRRGDLNAHDVARRQVHPDSAAMAQVRVLDSPQARLTRNLAVTEVPPATARAVPRNASRRPEMSDTVPEMRGDALTTIPVRHRGHAIDDRSQREAGTDPGAASAAPAGTPMRFGAAAPADGARPPATPLPAAVPRASHPTDVRSGQRTTDEGSDQGTPPRRSRGEADARTPATPPSARPRDGGSDADREVLRPMFRPLGRQRDGGDQGGRGQGENGNAGTARGGDGNAGRQAGAEGHPAGTAREREATPRQTPTPPPPPHNDRSQTQAQPRQEAPPRHEAPPAASDAASRRPRRDRDH